MKHPLIFDLGFYNGEDTEYYLAKGYNVVAVEANPELVNEGNKRFKLSILDNRLTLINKAVSDKKYTASFYIHPINPERSSCNKEWVTWDGCKPREIEVETITLEELYSYGTPYYMKVDIEDETVVAKQLLQNIEKHKPKYVSFELSRTYYYDIFCYLHVAGYNSYQLVNQANIEGKIDNDIGFGFGKFSSGLFAGDLPKKKWRSFDETLTNYIKFKDLRISDNEELALGWLDLHARRI